MAKPLGEPREAPNVNTRSTRSTRAAEKPAVMPLPATTTCHARAQSAMPQTLHVDNEGHEETDDMPAVPKTEPKPKAAPKKYPPVAKMPIPRKTRSQVALREAATTEKNEGEKFYDAEEQLADVKAEAVEAEVKAESTKPVKNPARGRGRAAVKKVTDTEEEADAVEEVTKPEPAKPKRGGRKPGQAPPAQDPTDAKDTNQTDAASVAEPPKNKRGRPKCAQPIQAAAIANNMGQHEEEVANFPYDNIKPRGRLQKSQTTCIKQEDDEDDTQTIDEKLAGLSLGAMILGKAGQKEKENAIYPLLSDVEDNIEGEVKQVKPKTAKARGRPRKATQDKKNGIVDVSGLELAFSYFNRIRELATMGDVGDMEQMFEMAEQGMETIQAALDAARDE